MSELGYYTLTLEQYASLTLADYYNLPLMPDASYPVVQAWQAFAGVLRAGATARLAEGQAGAEAE